MTEQKTKPTAQSVEDFISKIENEQVRDDCYILIKLMKKITGSKPVLWGPSIIGFGKYHYKYDSGHEGYSCLAAFSPRKPNITVYILPDFTQREALLKKLGKHKASKGCLYFKKLEDIDTGILEQLIEYSVKYTQKKYPDRVNT